MSSNSNGKDRGRGDKAASLRTGQAFRIAVEKDFPAVADIFSEATAQMRRHGIMQWDEVYPTAADLSADIIKKEMYILTDRGAAVSAIVVNEEQLGEYETGNWRFGGKVAALHRLCVHPSFQNKGYGKETVLLAERMMKDEGYSAVRLDAFSLNPYALRLYEGLGYIRAGETVFRTGKFILFEKSL